jgi:hypothetical protein
MFNATWSGSLEKIERELERCGSQAPKAISMSIKEAIVHSKAFAKRRIAEVYNISAANVGKTLSTKASGLSGELKAKGPMVDLYKAGAPEPSGPRYGKGPILTISVVKGQRTPFGNAFVTGVGTNSKSWHAGKSKTARRTIMKGGGVHVGVFTRDGKSRLPIRNRYTISTPEMMLAQRLNNSIPDDAGKYFQARLMHQIGRILGGTTI